MDSLFLLYHMLHRCFSLFRLLLSNNQYYTHGLSCRFIDESARAVIATVGLGSFLILSCFYSLPHNYFNSFIEICSICDNYICSSFRRPRIVYYRVSPNSFIWYSERSYLVLIILLPLYLQLLPFLLNLA